MPSFRPSPEQYAAMIEAATAAGQPLLRTHLVYCNTADDNTESDDTTSKGFLDQLQNVFTEDNANKAKEHFKGVFNSAKNLTDKLTNDVKKFFEITTAAPEP